MTEYRLGDCIELIIDYRGKTPQKMGSDWVKKGVRVISALNVHNGIIDNINDIRCVTDEIYKKWMQIEIKRNDIFLASEGASLGENAIWDSDEKIVLGQRLYAIRTNPQILDPWFLAAYMQTKKFRQQINQISTGSTVFGISQPVLLDVKIIIPNIEEQRKIGELYMNIFHRLENNNSICSDLEAMAKQLYDYWFVQFDFPDENGKPYKSSGGKMVWSEELKREIPEGWGIANFGSLVSMGNGINYDKNEVGDKTYKIVNVRNITASSLWMNINEFDDITLKSKQADRYLIDKNDILIARSGTPGAVRMIYEVPDDIIYCGFIIHALPKDGNQRLYLAYCLKQLEGTNATKTGGSILQNVSQDTLSAVSIILPNDRIIEKFNKQIQLFATKLNSIISENQQLISLRDFLLPMLMNGQVKIK